MEVQDVNHLINQFREAQKMMKMIQKTGGQRAGKDVWVKEEVVTTKVITSFIGCR